MNGNFKQTYQVYALGFVLSEERTTPKVLWRQRAFPVVELLLDGSILAVVIPRLFAAIFVDCTAQNYSPKLMALHQSSEKRPRWSVDKCWLLTRRGGVFKSGAHRRTCATVKVFLATWQKRGDVALGE